MTIAMIWLRRILPTRQRYSLPPREIILHLVGKVGVQKQLEREARAALPLINRFGFGATAAAICALVEARIPGVSSSAHSLKLYWPRKQSVRRITCSSLLGQKDCK